MSFSSSKRLNHKRGCVVRGLGFDIWINSYPDSHCFPMDWMPFPDLRLFDWKRYSSCQVPRWYDSYQQAVKVLMGEGKGPHHVNVPQMWRSVLKLFPELPLILSTWLLGVVLNLTQANNGISLDLEWSQAVELQAFDRVHRLGQMGRVQVQRVVIADTVEEQILKMQERKVLYLSGALEKTFSIHCSSKLSPTVVWALVPETRLAVSNFEYAIDLEPS